MDRKIVASLQYAAIMRMFKGRWGSVLADGLSSLQAKKTVRSSCEKRAVRFSGVVLCLGSSQSTQVGSHFLRGEGFKKVAFLQIAESAETDTALHAVGDFAGIVLEALERTDLAFVDLLPTAHHLDLGVTTDDSILNTAAGDGAHLGNAEDVDDFCAAHIVLFECGFEQSHHGQVHFVLQLVNDGVQSDLNVLLLRQLSCRALRARIE